MGHSTPGGRARKPREDFPLFPHASGRWAKKVRGKLEYFGSTAADPTGEKAIQEWLFHRDNLLAGRQRRPRNDDRCTVGVLVNEFLNSKRIRLESGEIAPRTFDEYVATGKRLAKVLGKNTPVVALESADFRKLRANIAKNWGPVRLSNEITRCRTVFGYGYPELYDQPVRYGSEFDKPTAKTIRKARAERGLKMFERDELRAVLDVAGPTLRAMIMLGINAGFGCTDCAVLPTKAVDLNTGWLSFPRPKTGVARRVPLWPETIKSILDMLAERPAPKHSADNDLLFISPRGLSYGGKLVYRVSSEMAKALAVATRTDDDGNTVPLTRPGLSFYSLRHTFQTIAEDSRDLAAVRAVMGHADAQNDMSAAYRERISDDRLQAAVDVVREWLFGNEKKAGDEGKPDASGHRLRVVG